MSTESSQSKDRPAVDLALLVVRVVLGVIFMAHGSQKLFGMFDGPGLAGVVKMMGPIGYLVSIGEFFGDLGLVVGFLTRFSAASHIVIMSGAIAMVHARNGFFLKPDGANGFEYNLALIGLAAAIVIAGPGVDHPAYLPLLPKSSRTGRPIVVLE